MSEPTVKSLGAHERNAVPEVSIDLGLELISRLQLKVEFETIGERICTTICRLSNERGEVSNGFGKGIGQQTKASAIFEALEHYYSIFANSWTVDCYRFLDFDRADDRIGKGCPELSRIIKSGKVAFSMTRFRNLVDPWDIIEFPTFLTDPGFESLNDEERETLRIFGLKRYATNSGTASGINDGEATLHGILELVERDALGVELLRTVVRSQPLPVREIIFDTLPDELQATCLEIAKEARSEIRLWNFSSDNTVPVVLAALRNSTVQEGQYFGSGASLSLGYAIERASLEALQRFHLYKLSKLARPFGTLASTDSLPTYVRCLLEKGIFGYKGGAVSVAYDEPHREVLESSIDDQITYLLARLKAFGHEIFQRPLKARGLSVSQVVAPSLERFHLVARGVPVAPGRRGRLVLEECL
ncbi:YcaO-like family protein [Ensifer adhaerens]|uniref:YcaO-like family protein n=1 Tax=Ensifer adhaerens TaxID=106592 RepID=UPI001C4DF94F|nr:YcaO-like family protein [Ensifer adhaerens]MBW0366116.1 YcaO-like family protein [Ensifer adhaerens]UCM19989.1 YcaO-like family protein [Ensifer adhaerens]